MSWVESTCVGHTAECRPSGDCSARVEGGQGGKRGPCACKARMGKGKGAMGKGKVRKGAKGGNAGGQAREPWGVSLRIARPITRADGGPITTAARP